MKLKDSFFSCEGKGSMSSHVKSSTTIYKKMRLLLFLLFVSFCVFLIGYYSYSGNLLKRLPPKLKYAVSVGESSIKKIEDKYKDISNTGIGWGSVNEQFLKKISISFNSYKQISVEKAREMMVDSINILVDEANKCEKLKPFLINGYFYPYNSDILFYIHHDREEVDFTIAKCDEGKIQYIVRENNVLIFSEIETYEEAVQKIENKRN